MRGLFSVYDKESVHWDKDLLEWGATTVEVYGVRDDNNGYPHFLICENGEWKYKSAKHFANRLPINWEKQMPHFELDLEVWIIVSNNEEDNGRYYGGEGYMTNDLREARFYASEDLAYTELSKFDEYRKYEVRKVVTHLNLLEKQS